MQRKCIKSKKSPKGAKSILNFIEFVLRPYRAYIFYSTNTQGDALCCHYLSALCLPTDQIIINTRQSVWKRLDGFKELLDGKGIGLTE